MDLWIYSSLIIFFQKPKSYSDNSNVFPSLTFKHFDKVKENIADTKQIYNCPRFLKTKNSVSLCCTVWIYISDKYHWWMRWVDGFPFSEAFGGRSMMKSFKEKIAQMKRNP